MTAITKNSDVKNNKQIFDNKVKYSRGFPDLPNEVVLKIFAYVPSECLCLSVPYVCKRWYNLYADASLWQDKKLTVTFTTEIPTLKRVFARCPMLKTFEICDRKDVYIVVYHLISYHVKVNKIKLKYCQLGKNEVSTLMLLLHHCPNLQTLKLEGTELKDAYSCHIISRFSQLKSLGLGLTKFPVDVVLRRIIDDCPQLRKLQLPCITAFDSDISYIVDHSGDRLEALYVNGELTNNSLETLTNCKRLQRLHIFYCDHMSDEGLLKKLGYITTLVSLGLNRGNHFTKQGLKKLMNKDVINNLIELDLSFCSKVNDEVMIGLAKKQRNLRYFSIQSCHNVGEQGLLAIFSCCPKLVYLNLREVKNITGILSFALIPHCLPKLRYLNVTETSVSDNVICDLLQDMPTLQVLNSEGKLFIGGKIKLD